jgi:hypothetical protein
MSNMAREAMTQVVLVVDMINNNEHRGAVFTLRPPCTHLDKLHSRMNPPTRMTMALLATMK